MTTRIIPIPADRITDAASFHEVFAEALGFPAFFGRNMDAWIDVMSSLDDPDPMSSVRAEPGQTLTLRIDGADDLQRRCPDLFKNLIECSGFVNWRRVEAGDPPILALLLVGRF